MKRFLTILGVTSLSVSLLWADVRPFDLYQPIIDRCPFGQPPPNFDPTASPTARGASAGDAEEAEILLSEQQELLQKAVNATVIYIEPMTRTPWLGFADTTDPKAPRNHLVALGGSEDGWTVKEIDPEKKTAKLSKDDVEIDVTVGVRPEKAAADVKGGGALGRRVGLLSARGGAPVANERSPLLSGPRSMRSRRQERLDREKEENAARLAEAEERKKMQEEQDKKLAQEKAEREAEREEMRERLRTLADDLEKQIQEKQQQQAANAEEGEGSE